MRSLLSILKALRYIHLKYILYGSLVVVEKDAFFEVGRNVTLKRSRIYLKQGSKLKIASNVAMLRANMKLVSNLANITIGEQCRISDTNFYSEGLINIGSHNIFEKGIQTNSICVVGKLIIGSYNRLRCDISLRFWGELSIGTYNNINEGSELRCDESIRIGSYNQISYDCMIWDTNTHNIYSPEKRRMLTEKHYPLYGLEDEKPKTLPVSIGDDCWIGKDSAILKGTTINNNSIVGFRTLLINTVIPENTTVIQKVTICQITH